MKSNQADEFFNNLLKDKELFAKFTENYRKFMLNFASGCGFNFTLDDLNIAIDNLKNSGYTELNESELSGIAAGGFDLSYSSDEFM